jgi:hypothetical protein
VLRDALHRRAEVALAIARAALAGPSCVKVP